MSAILVVRVTSGVLGRPDVFHLGCGHTVEAEARTSLWTYHMSAYRVGQGEAVPPLPPARKGGKRKPVLPTVSCRQCDAVTEAAKSEVKHDAAGQTTILGLPQKPRCDAFVPGHPKLRCERVVHAHDPKVAFTWHKHKTHRW